MSRQAKAMIWAMCIAFYVTVVMLTHGYLKQRLEIRLLKGQVDAYQHLAKYHELVIAGYEEECTDRTDAPKPGDGK